jgi:hypothetical protein
MKSAQTTTAKFRKPGNSTATKSSEIDTLSLLQPQDPRPRF